MIRSFIIFIVTVVLISSCSNNEREFFNGDNSYPDPANVKLLEGPFLESMDRTAGYLKSLDPDRFLHYFRLNAGLDTLKPSYGGWETREVRGHSLGHYLSACAFMYNSHGDTILRQNALYIIDVLGKCQESYGTGYLSAFPEEFIDRVEKQEQVWAPYYTLHKIMAGLYDCYRFLDSDNALSILAGMADWLDGRCSSLSYSDMQNILDHTEQGGMNEVLLNLYSVTGETKYLDLSRKFYQESYFRPVLSYYDSLKGLHVNSYIPNVIGLVRDYELTGKEDLYRISDWFWKEVTEARSFVTGGTSNDEHWNSDPYHMHTELGPSSHETCCTYNMLKLTKHLFAINPDGKYMDYYERALWNGILPTQDPESGMTMYYVPMQSGYYKTFGTAENSFWCCTGTGMENFARSGEAIYMTGNNRLYVNLYIASELRLPDMSFSLVQKTKFPEDERVSFEIKTDNPGMFYLCLRIPSWAGRDYKLEINGKTADYSVKPGNYIEIWREWKNGDKVNMLLPVNLHIESLPSTHEYRALMLGPLVMSACLSDTALTADNVYGNYGPYNDEPQKIIPAIAFNNDADLLDSFRDSGKLKFTVNTGDGDSLEFIPFYKLFNTRYMIYFKDNPKYETN